MSAVHMSGANTNDEDKTPRRMPRGLELNFAARPQPKPWTARIDSVAATATCETGHAEERDRAWSRNHTEVLTY
ncbi:MAG: hypothetical protein RL591_2534, partial [Planctomycetota bacterium]